MIARAFAAPLVIVDAPIPDLTGHTAILVDDGLCAGDVARAAIRRARERGAARVIVAAPIGVESVIEALCSEADELVYVYAPEEWESVSSHYARAA